MAKSRKWPKAQFTPLPTDSHAAQQGEGEATKDSTDSKADTQADAQGNGTQEKIAQSTAEQTTQIHDSNKAGETGNATALSGGGDDGSRVRVREVVDRLVADGRWRALGLAGVRDEMVTACKRQGMSSGQAIGWVYSELDRLYPPILIDPKAQSVALLKTDSSQQEATQGLGKNLPPTTSEGVRVQGLGDLPPGWPELPANASLAAEIGWVQANRLYVVEEQAAGGTRVRLDRAHEPAPSRAAIGWLETSVRSYAKYVEVAAKATSTAQDEQAQVRAERVVMDEIRALLAEML